MRYTTILVHVDDSTAAPGRVDGAIALARHQGAHLIGLATSGISRALIAALPPEQDDPTLALHLGYVREQASAALARFSSACEQAGLPSFDARLVDDEAIAGLALHARATDLTLLGQDDPDAKGADGSAAGVVTRCGVPVLVLPSTRPSVPLAIPSTHALIAWDASAEAARALRGALPLLKCAHRVTVLTLDSVPPSHTSLDARSADPLPLLARHGIAAQHLFRSLDGARLLPLRHPAGETLLNVCGQLQADLLVMGAYAHSRLRETLLGGVTRTLFDRMTLPVLMAH